MNRIYLTILVILATACSYASHISGIDIRYNSIGPQTLELEIKIFRDCNGISYSKQNLKISGASTCGAFSKEISLVSSVPRIIKRGNTSLSRCSGGSWNNPGYHTFTYFDTIQIPIKCKAWKFSFTTECCRNNIANASGSSAYSYFHVLDSLPNRSPIYRQGNIQFYEVGVWHQFNASSVDPDGDSLYYEMANPFSNSLNRISYKSGYTFLKPISNFSMDNRTGIMRFNNANTGNFQLGVITKEYDRKTKKLKSVHLRDVQFHFDLAGNMVPVVIDSLVSLNNARFKYKGLIQICSGIDLDYSILVIDPDSSGNIMAFCDSILFPGVKAYISYPDTSRTDSAIINIKGTLPSFLQPGVKVLELIIRDGKFPNFGYIRYNIPIEIDGGVVAFHDTVICGPTQFARLSTRGSDKVWWKSLPGGDPMKIGSLTIPGNNFNCDTCFSVLARPSKTTRYEVIGDTNVVGRCKVRDTVEVKVVPDFLLTVSNDTTLCSTHEAIISAYVPSGSGYKINWSPNHFMNSDTGRQVRITDPLDNLTYTALVKSPLGCYKKDSVNISVIYFPKNNKLKNYTGSICIKDTLDINLELGQIQQSLCNTTPLKCPISKSHNFPSNYVRLETSHGHPFGFWNETSWKIQYLLTKSELLSAGVNPAPITSLSFMVDSSTILLDSIVDHLELKISCTSKSRFSSGAFIPVTQSSVFSGQVNLIKSRVGNLLKLEFTKAFNWDGKSNLVFEFCAIDTKPNNRLALVYARVNHNSQATNSSKAINACNHASYSSAFSGIPLMIIETCDISDTSLYSYKWYAGSTQLLFPDSVPNQRIVVDTSYQKDLKLVIKDSTGMCFDTLFPTINMVSKYDVKPRIISGKCMNDAPFYLKSNTPYNIIKPGGKWFGVGIIDDTLGIWDPRLSGLGNHLVKYEVKGNLCANSDTSYLKVSRPPDPEITSRGPFCLSDSIAFLTAKTPGGVFTGRGVDSSKGILNLSSKYFNVSGGNADTFFLTYNVSNNGCEAFHRLNVKVRAGFDTNVVLTQRKFCLENKVYQFSNKSGNGKWSGKGILNSKGNWNAQNAGLGLHKLTLDSNGICGRTHSFFVSVNPLPAPIISRIPAFHPPLSNQSFVLKGIPSNGDWSIAAWGVNKQKNYSFVPKNQSSGIYPVEYSSTNSSGCTGTVQSLIYICSSNVSQPKISSPQFGILESDLTGIKYEWYRNDSLLSYTTQRISDRTIGSYKVSVITGSCKSPISDPFMQAHVGVNTFDATPIPVIQPNPVVNNETLQIDNLPANSVVKFISISGKLILEVKQKEIENGVIELAELNLPVGICMIRISTPTSSFDYKLVILE